VVLNIYERIKYLRKDKLNQTQDEFSKNIKISRSNLGSIETGRVSVTDRVISDICQFYDVSEDWIRNGGPDEEIFIEFSEDAEIAKYTQDLLMDTDDVIATTIKNFIVLYGKMDENSKQVLRNVHKELFSTHKKEEQT
jgi:transcriptional regulator with XRE-family HTH domain